MSNKYLRPWQVVDSEELRLLREIEGMVRLAGNNPEPRLAILKRLAELRR